MPRLSVGKSTGKKMESNTYDEFQLVTLSKLYIAWI